MALLWFEGFENRRHGTYLSRLYDSVTGSATFPAGSELFCAQSANLVLTKVFTSQSTWIVGVRFRLPEQYSGGASNQAVILSNSSGEQLRFTWQPATVTPGQMIVQVKRGATVLASSVDLWVGKWIYFEFKAVVDNAAGSYEVKADGVTILSDAGPINTANQGVANADRVALSFAAGVICQMDDAYICDGSGGAFDNFLGPKRIYAKLPSAEGTTIEWTPSTGTNNAALVDDPATAPDDTDKVTAEDVNIKDLYAWTASSPVNSNTTLHAVQITETMAMDSSGTRTVAPRVRSGGMEADGTGVAVNSLSLSSRSEVMTENPVDANPWDKTSLDAAEFGVRVVS